MDQDIVGINFSQQIYTEKASSTVMHIWGSNKYLFSNRYLNRVRKMDVLTVTSLTWSIKSDYFRSVRWFYLFPLRQNIDETMHAAEWIRNLVIRKMNLFAPYCLFAKKNRPANLAGTNEKGKCFSTQKQHVQMENKPRTPQSWTSAQRKSLQTLPHFSVISSYSLYLLRYCGISSPVIIIMTHR